MIRQHQLYPNGPWIRLCTHLDDVKRCRFVDAVRDSEELWMRFDTTYSSDPSDLPAGTPLVLILAPGDEDEGYPPSAIGDHDLRYHLESQARYHPANCPYVKLGIITEAQMQILCDQVKVVDAAKKQAYERKQYERLKQLFDPLPEPVVVKIKVKPKMVFRGRKEAKK